ncbi:stage II sporulation protein M [Desulfolucanica intricata]|uniref:stage II sporulation protein M n=1 Tax=Desulfolucanica intricata TaxID=1285191 RepID=UPI00083721EE|nr:stage II sporulation protein M [Desulfolucanica intricata]
MSVAFQHVWGTILRKSWPFYGIVFLVLCLGITVGSLTANGLGGLQASELQDYLERFLEQVPGIKINNIDLMQTSVVNNILLLVIVYFLGLTVIGIPIMLALIFARGFILGFAVGFLFKEKALRGIILAFAAILPQNLLYIPALIIGGGTALAFTLLLIKRNFDSSIKIWPGFLYYNCIMLVVFAIALGSSMIEAYVTPFLTKFVTRLIS